jgi:lambda family phage portal protein
MGFFDRFRGTRTINSVPHDPGFGGVGSMVLNMFRPSLREQQDEVSDAWNETAARALRMVVNSGFLTGAVNAVSAAVVGPGLRLSLRPDYQSLGWDEKDAREWSSKAEKMFRAWASTPMECDAAGELTLSQMQQAQFAAYLAYGESLALIPVVKRSGSSTATKVSLVPPSRIEEKNDPHNNLYMGVRTNRWGMPKAYRIKEWRDGQWVVRELKARDRGGLKNISHCKDPSIATTRGFPILGPILKASKQFDQYADGNMQKMMIQTIFAAVLTSKTAGPAAFDGIMTDTDRKGLESFAKQRKQWYSSAKIDLREHGRIAHLAPDDELNFVEAKGASADYDIFVQWLLREIAVGLGVTYDTVSGDDRGATYSSIRMGSAKEWLRVEKWRENIVIPFSNAVLIRWMDEAIATGRLDFPGGYEVWRENMSYAARGTWAGPAKPQADDFKTARAHEVLKDVGATTLRNICEEYGWDIGDIMEGQARENERARELGLPLPWAPKDLLETDEGLDLELNAPPDEGPTDKRRRKSPSRKRNRPAPRNPSDKEPTGTNLNVDLEEDMINGD